MLMAGCDRSIIKYLLMRTMSGLQSNELRTAMRDSPP